MTDTQVIAGTLIVRPQGELDVHTAAAFRTDTENALAETGARRLIVSLKNIAFMDSSGLGALLGRYRRMIELGGRLYLVSIPARVRPVLELSGILKIIPVFESEKRALERI